MNRFLFLSIAVFSLAACRFRSGSGNIISEKRETAAFTGVSVSDGLEAEVRTGPVQEVVVEADDNIIKSIDARVSDGILKIGIRGPHNYSNVHLKVYITAPEIVSIRASGGSDVDVTELLKSKGLLSFDASGGAGILADLDAPSVEVRASGGATVKLSGRTQNYDVDVSGGGEVSSGNLITENTVVRASSGSNAIVHASLSLKANASSGAEVVYTGGAVVQKTVSSGGSVEKRN